MGSMGSNELTNGISEITPTIVYNTLAGFGGAIFCLYCVCLRVVLHEVDAPMRSAYLTLFIAFSDSTL